MKFKHLAKCLLIIPCLGISPLFSVSSCKNVDNVAKKIDGSDWIGVTPGCFFDVFDYNIDEENHTITYNASKNFQGRNIVVPNYVKDEENEYKVLLGPSCFKENGGILGTFECNDFIDSIPESCFEGAWQLNQIIMHNYPTSIGNSAFAMTSLSDFFVKQNNVLDKNWTINLESIGTKAFQNLPRLTGDLFFSDKFGFIGDFAFDHCSRLTGLDFRFCYSLFHIPNSAFMACTLLQNLILPPNIITIGENAFRGCSGFSKIILPKDGMSFSLGMGTFYDCTNFYNFSRQCHLVEIGESCFGNDISLSPDFMPWETSGLEVISTSAFTKTNYNTLIFHDNCPHDIYTGAFNSCEQLNRLDFSGCSPNIIPKWTGTDIFLYASPTGVILLPHGANKDQWASLFYNGVNPKQGIIIDATHWQIQVA